MSGPRGLKLSGTQVIASVLATLSAAVAASYLGVAGTLVGAAVGSVVSTMGTEIYKHYLQRSRERLRTAGQVLYHSAARTRTGDTLNQPAASSGGRQATYPRTAGQPGVTQDLGRQGAAGQDAANRETAVWDRRQYGVPRDAHETEMIPGLSTQWAGAGNGAATNGGSPNGGSSGASRPDGASASRQGSASQNSASEYAHGSITPEGPSGDAGGRGSLWEAITSFFGSLTRRQWLTYGGIAAGFFVVVLAGITVVELTVGKPVDAMVYGRHASGTSVGNALSGHRSPRQKPTTQPSGTSSATPTVSGSASATPSSVPSSATPTPSISVAPSSSSTGAATTPTTGSAARSSGTATPTP
jgi:hypothetical protein